MIDISRYERAKKRVEKHKNQAARLAGAFEEIQKRIKDEFGCDTIEEAEAKCAQKEKKANQLRKRIDELLTQFEEEWKAKFEDSDEDD